MNETPGTTGTPEANGSRPSNLSLETSDGCTLDADLFLPAAPLRAAVLCHPHPQRGGDRHNSVVDAVWRELIADGSVAALRFDFRGVGRSTGVYGDGKDERLDVLAAIDHLDSLRPGLPITVVGYSFGSIVASNIVDPRVSGWVLIAPPLVMAPADPPCAGDARPKLVIHGDNDQFTALADVERRLAAWTDARLVSIRGADHFLSGHLAGVAAPVAAFVAR